VFSIEIFIYGQVTAFFVEMYKKHGLFLEIATIGSIKKHL
jgi:hypothetical protein